MNRVFLISGLLPLTAVSLLTGCVDDKYDLSNIDTTSRFTVDNLTVPVNLSEIKLEKVIKLDDNDNISVENGEYAIKKSGSIAPTEFKISGVHVNAPQIAPTSIHVGLNGLPIAPGTFIPGAMDFGPIAIQPSDLVGYEFNMQNIDKALLALKNIKTTPIEVKVVLTVPDGLAASGNNIMFENLELQLPWGLTEVSGVTSYDPSTGKVKVSSLPVGSNGHAVLAITAKGLELNEKGEIKNQRLAVSGQVGVIDGEIKLAVQDITLPASLDISVSYQVSAFDVESFSGSIDYNMDDISIAPISLSDLPDFLDNPNTNIILANPEITVEITNPVAKYGLVGKGRLSLSSDFNDGFTETRRSDIFTLTDRDGDGSCRIVFATQDKNGEKDLCLFTGLGYVLTRLPENPAGISWGWGLPKSIAVAIEDLGFAGEVRDFPLGNIGSAAGDYEFNAPLGFESGTTVFYETTESGWSSEDLDKVNIKTIHLSGKCSTDLPVGIKLSVVPVDKDGNDIPVNEDSMGFMVPANASGEPVSLTIESKNGGTISGFDGIRFVAVISQNGPEFPSTGDTEALGPDMQIKLDDLRVTVDGYYETDF